MNRPILVLSFIALIVSSLILFIKPTVLHKQAQNPIHTTPTVVQDHILKTMPTTSSISNITSRLRPIYFVSHGGPTFMYRDDDFGDAGAFDIVQKMGQSLLADPPKALVIVSAHWQEDHSNSPNGLPTIGITSTDGDNKLIYDFFGFPSHMYKEQFHTRGSKKLSQHLANKIAADGNFNVRLYGNRGFDHGLWVPFRVAFPEHSIQKELNYVPFPVIQVSLPSSGRSLSAVEDVTRDTYKLGAQLKDLRDRLGEDIAVVCSGMSVHNLREMWQYQGSVAPYAKPYENLLKQAVTEMPTSKRLDKLITLFKEPITSQAHPTIEHILPISAALGLSEEFIPPSVEGELSYGESDFSNASQLYSRALSSLSWGIYKFGRD